MDYYVLCLFLLLATKSEGCKKGYKDALNLLDRKVFHQNDQYLTTNEECLNCTNCAQESSEQIFMDSKTSIKKVCFRN